MRADEFIDCDGVRYRIETFSWRGQKRYQCPCCAYDGYHLPEFVSHIRAHVAKRELVNPSQQTLPIDVFVTPRQVTSQSAELENQRSTEPATARSIEFDLPHELDALPAKSRARLRNKILLIHARLMKRGRETRDWIDEFGHLHSAFDAVAEEFVHRTDFQDLVLDFIPTMTLQIKESLRWVPWGDVRRLLQGSIIEWEAKAGLAAVSNATDRRPTAAKEHLEGDQEVTQVEITARLDTSPAANEKVGAPQHGDVKTPGRSGSLNEGFDFRKTESGSTAAVGGSLESTHEQQSQIKRKSGRPIKDDTRKIQEAWIKMGRPRMSASVCDQLAGDLFPEQRSRIETGSKGHKNLRDRIRAAVQRHDQAAATKTIS